MVDGTPILGRLLSLQNMINMSSLRPLGTTTMIPMPPKQNWLEAWEPPPIRGIMLLTSKTLKETLVLYQHAYAGCLHLLCLSFDSSFQLDLAIDYWTDLLFN